MQDMAKQMRRLGRQQGRAMRDKARAIAAKRKEEYLGARVPKELRDKVIAKANSLGIPVSILIRNILEASFSGGIESGRDGSDMPGDGGRGTRFPSVIGWEAITLNRTMRCSACSHELAPGTVVTLGLGAPGEDHVILCGKCKETA